MQNEQDLLYKKIRKQLSNIDMSDSIQEEKYRIFEKAVANRDVKTVEKFIAEGIDVNHIIKHVDDSVGAVYYPVIHKAIHNSDYQITEMLLRAGTKSNICWTIGESNGATMKSTPLNTAIFKCHDKSEKSFDVLKLLLDYGFDPDASLILELDGSVHNQPALWDLIDAIGESGKDKIFYSYSYDFRIIDLLIEHGANVNRTMPSPEANIPLLFFAIQHENEELVKKLLSVGASWDTEIVTKDHPKCSLRKFSINEYVSNTEFLRFLRKNGWKGEGLFGWRG